MQKGFLLGERKQLLRENIKIQVGGACRLIASPHFCIPTSVSCIHSSAAVLEFVTLSSEAIIEG